jgi:hypothetical protein
MSTHADKAAALAEKITKKAEDALSGIEREMSIMKWPAEFRAIMWGAVEHIAFKRKFEAECATNPNRSVRER